MHRIRLVALAAVLSACSAQSLAPTTSREISIGHEGSTMCLNADGEGGRDAYELIESVFGVGSIEAPDGDHAPPVRHVQEDVDDDVGAHFVFLLHRDVDLDRGRVDRQRMEIKVFDKSDDGLKGFRRTAFSYSWRVKLGEGMTVSKKATHLFQLKSVGGDDQMPIVTLTGAKRPHGDRLEVRFTTGGPDTDVLADTDWSPLRGEWLDVRCQAAFDHHGSLALSVTRPGGEVVIDVRKTDIDLWRDGEFVRPKWGIYRGLADAAELRPDEERVRFSSFAVTPSFDPSSDCGGRSGS